MADKLLNVEDAHDPNLCLCLKGKKSNRELRSVIEDGVNEPRQATSTAKIIHL